jgi:hypothetical protein
MNPPETYKSLSIVGTEDKYTIDCSTHDFDNVTRLELGSYEGPMMTLQNVDLGANTLNFTEGFQLGLNRMRYWNGTQDPPTLYELFVPNHLNPATVIEDGDSYILETALPLSLRAYFAWKRASTITGPALSLLLADTHNDSQPQLFLNEDNIETIDATHFRLAKSVATLNDKCFFHHIPWHICELLDFVNFAVDSDLEASTFPATWGKYLSIQVSEGVSKFVNNSDFEFDPSWDEAVPPEYTSMFTFGMVDFIHLPFTFVGVESRTTPPRMQAVVPPGTYSGSDMLQVLPAYMNVGHLPEESTFLVMEGLQARTVRVAAGYHATPFALLTAIRAGLTAAGVSVQCQYANDGASFRTPGCFEFVGTEQPFLLDFRATSMELRIALNVTDRQYGPDTVIKADADAVFPQLWDDSHSHLIYEVGMHDPNSFTLTAFNPSHVETAARATQEGQTLVLRVQDPQAFPYQVNDVCFMQQNQHSTSARILALGQVYRLEVTQAFELDEFLTVLEEDESILTVVCNVGDYNLVPNATTIISAEKLDEVALIAEVQPGFWGGVDVLDMFTIGYLDPPRFEVEAELKSLAPRLGVGSNRLDGGFFYKLNAFDFDPIPYLLLYVDAEGGSGNPEHKNFFDIPTADGVVERTRYPLAKLVMSTPYTVTRHQIMDHKLSQKRNVHHLTVAFEKPDGSRVNFQGRAHGLTIGFYCQSR